MVVLILSCNTHLACEQIKFPTYVDVGVACLVMYTMKESWFNVGITSSIMHIMQVYLLMCVLPKPYHPSF